MPIISQDIIFLQVFWYLNRYFFNQRDKFICDLLKIFFTLKNKPNFQKRTFLKGWRLAHIEQDPIFCFRVYGAVDKEGLFWIRRSKKDIIGIFLLQFHIIRQMMAK